jgi:predicted AlkP superfamily pyrophosphatase or phosphodiesterase
MHMNDVDVHAFSTPADLWISVRQLLEEKPRQRLYAWVYWGAVDGLSHHHQPDDERTAAEFSQFSAAFEEYFLNRLSAAGRKNTLVILTADHGQIYTPDQQKYLLTRHPELDDMLHICPTGENRLMFLYPKAGKLDAVRAYIEETWPGDFACFTPDQALQSELFGPGPHHPDLRNRIGDLIVAARGEAYLWWGGEENPLRGRHGGLHPQEMLVPFLAAQL